MLHIALRRLAALTVVPLGVIAGISSAPGSAAALTAEATPDVQVIIPSDIRQHELFQVVVVVSNPENVAFQQVNVVGAYEDCAAPDVVFTGPTETVGNNDEFLDPGEEWRFEGTCRAENVNLGVTVTALDMDGKPVAVTTRPIEFTPLPAFLVETSPSATRVPVGGEVTWTVKVTNLSTTLLDGFGAEARFLYPGWRGPIANEPLTPIERGNGDDFLDPGETWSFARTDTLITDGFLEVGVWAKPHETRAHWLGQTEHSDQVSVYEPSTPDTTQPEAVTDSEDIGVGGPPETVDVTPPSTLPYTGIPLALAFGLSLAGLLTGLVAVRAARTREIPRR